MTILRYLCPCIGKSPQEPTFAELRARVVKLKLERANTAELEAAMEAYKKMLDGIFEDMSLKSSRQRSSVGQ